MYIRIKNVFKRYGNNIILNYINYEFKDKHKYIIKGVNGVGKTTLIKCILNQITYYGLIDTKGVISYSTDQLIFPSYVSLYSFIKCFSELKNRIKDFNSELDKYLEIFNMTKYKYSFLGSLSKGQKAKVNIILALIKKSDILIFDEPYSGLDDDSKNRLTEILINLKKLIIVVSHENYIDSKEFIKVELKKDEIIELS